MKYFLFLSLIVFIACENKAPASGSSKIVLVDSAHLLYPYNEPRINWKTVEKQNDTLKKIFIAHHPTNFDNAYNGYMHPGDTQARPPEPNKLNDALHIIDFDSDGKDDIIYEGTGGWETNKIFIYLNKPKGFDLIFVDLQYVKKLEFKDGRVWRLYTFNPGCCDDYMVFDKIFEFSYQGEPKDFKEIYSTGYYKTTLLSKAYLDKPIKFTTVSRPCKLRTQPKVSPNDSLHITAAYHIGNDVGNIAKGSLGRAIAIETDKNGAVWWLVEMDKKAKISGNVLYNELSPNDYSGKVGWISSSEVKTLDQQ